MSDREWRDEFEAYCEIPERRSKCKEPDRNRYTSSDGASQATTCKSTSGVVVQCGNATLTAWSRTQQTVSLSSAEAESYALTTGIAKGKLTKHLLQEFGHEVALMIHVDSQSAKAWASKRGLGRMKHVILKYMFVQDVVEKKLTNLSHINTKQHKADLMTKCHTSEAHKKERLCDDGIETRLKQNREVTKQCENETKRKSVRRSQSEVMRNMKWREEV